MTVPGQLGRWEVFSLHAVPAFPRQLLQGDERAKQEGTCLTMWPTSGSMGQAGMARASEWGPPSLGSGAGCPLASTLGAGGRAMSWSTGAAELLCLGKAQGQELKARWAEFCELCGEPITENGLPWFNQCSWPLTVMSLPQPQGQGAG